MKLALAFLLLPLVANASISESKLGRYKGYTILGTFTVTGWQDDGGENGTSFNGCNHGRKIIFDNNKQLTCATYSYSYSYRPDALILVKGDDFIMLIDGSDYQMRK